MRKKVVPIAIDRSSFETVEKANADVSNIFPGFSQRLNELIDKTSLEIPPLDGGRQMALASLVKTSKMATGHWLKNNRPPKASTLRNLVVFLVDYIDKKVNPLKVEAWLKYGEPAIQSPFKEEVIDKINLSPIALAKIVEVCSAKGIEINSFDLKKVLDATIRTMESFEIYSEESFNEKHKEVIYQYIKLNN
ncbi:MAG: hypothetical protein ACI82Z_001449 [Cellvibrionaceae bacterium]|jgi:hypothetical protein